MTLFNIFVSEVKRTPGLIISKQSLQGVFPGRPAFDAARAIAEATNTAAFEDAVGNFKFCEVNRVDGIEFVMLK